MTHEEIAKALTEERDSCARVLRSGKPGWVQAAKLESAIATYDEVLSLLAKPDDPQTKKFPVFSLDRELIDDLGWDSSKLDDDQMRQIVVDIRSEIGADALAEIVNTVVQRWNLPGTMR